MVSLPLIAYLQCCGEIDAGNGQQSGNQRGMHLKQTYVYVGINTPTLQVSDLRATSSKAKTPKTDQKRTKPVPFVQFVQHGLKIDRIVNDSKRCRCIAQLI
jgi:hypothetical protein